MMDGHAGGESAPGDIVGELSTGEDPVDLIPRRQFTRPKVPPGGVGAQLKHVPQDQQAGPGSGIRLQQFTGRLERQRAGVVGVVDDRPGTDALNPAAVGQRVEASESVGDLLRGQPNFTGQGDGGERADQGVSTRCREFPRGAISGEAEAPRGEADR